MQLMINRFRLVRFPENSLGIIIFASFGEALSWFVFEADAISFGFGWEELNCRREARKD